MSKVKELALKEYPVVMTTLIPADDEHPLIEQDCNKFIREAYIKGYKQAEKDIKEELSKLFQEFTLDCIGDNKDIHILHFMDVFKNKLKEIGNEYIRRL